MSRKENKIGNILAKFLDVKFKHVEFIPETQEYDTGEILEFNRKGESSACRTIQYHLENNKKSYIEIYKDMLEYMINNECYCWNDDYISAYIAEKYSEPKNNTIYTFDINENNIKFAQLYSILKSYKSRFIIGIKYNYLVNNELLYIYMEDGCISDISLFDEEDTENIDNILLSQVLEIIPLNSIDYDIMFNEIDKFKNKSVLELLGIKVKNLEVDNDKYYPDIALLSYVAEKKYEDIYKEFVNEAVFLTEDMQKHNSPDSYFSIRRCLSDILSSKFDLDRIDTKPYNTTDARLVFPASCLDFLLRNKKGKFIIDIGYHMLSYDNGTLINSINTEYPNNFEHLIVNAELCRASYKLTELNK